MTEEVFARRCAEGQVALQAEQREKAEMAASFLLQTGHNGIFYQSQMIAYLIPTPPVLGYKVAPMRSN